MILTDSSSAYAGSNAVRTIASFGSNLHHFTTYADTTLSRVISGNNIGILKNGSGVLTLSAVNTYTGNATISSGVMSIINTNALPGFNANGRFAVAPNATLGVYNAVTDAEITTLLNTTNFRANAAIGFDTTSGDRTYTPAIVNTSQGALGITKLGLNTLTISSNVNTYTGPTLVIAGTLATSAGNRIPDASAVTILSGATVVLGGSETLATISGRGTLNCQANNITLNSNNNSTFSGTLTSTASSGSSIYKVGTNTITLSGATVRVSGLSSAIRMETGGVTLVDNTSFIQSRTSDGPRNFQMALNAGTTFNLTISGGASLTTAGCMFGENNGGSATVTLLSGGTWISGSGGGTTWMSGLSSILNINGGSFSAISFYMGGGPSGTTSIINLNSGLASFTTFLIWQGGGKCTFNLNGGTATFANFQQSTLTDNTFNFNGGTFTTQNGDYSYNYSMVKYIVKSGGAIFNIPAGRTTSFATSVLSADNVSTGGGLVKTGAGTLSLGSAANTFTGQVSASEGIISVTTINNNSTNGPFGNSTFPLVLGSNGKSGTLSYGGINLTSNKPITLCSGGIGVIDVITSGVTYTNIGNIHGSGTFIKNGAGTLALSANNTFDGNSILNAGVLIVGSNSALGIGNNINLNGIQILSDTTTQRTLSNNTISLSSDTIFPTAANEKALTFTGTTTIFGATRTLTVQTGSTVTSEYINFAGSIQDNGNGYGLIKAGTGTLVLSGNNTYSGNTTINAGNLRMLYLPVGEIRFGGGTLQYGTEITTDLSFKIRNNTNTVRVDTNGQTVVFGSLSSSNTGGLLKIGTGTLILTGSNNTYMSNNGTTISNGGTLTYAGTHRTPAVINISNAANITTGVITISGSLTQTASPAGTRSVAIAEAPNAVGTLNIVSGATVELSGGMMMGGNNANPTGILNMYGGSLNTRGQLWPCGNSVINVYNGTIDTNGNTLYLGGGGTTPVTSMTSTLNLSGGTLICTEYNLGIGQLSAANTVTNLVSGTLSIGYITNNSRPNNTHTFNFNGGVLNLRTNYTVSISNTTFNIKAGGAVIDVNSGITQTFLNTFLDGSGGGGLTKLGQGTLALSGINTYTGTTNISAGTLRVLKKISGTGSDASFTQANFTPTTLTVTFVSGTPPSVGNTYKLFSGATQQSYSSVTLVNYSGTASYNSTDSTLTINT